MKFDMDVINIAVTFAIIFQKLLNEENQEDLKSGALAAPGGHRL